MTPQRMDTVGIVVIARLRVHGGELLGGEVAQYEDMYRLCYMRGPAGIILALSETIG